MTSTSDDTNEAPDRPVKAAIAKVKEALGWATADRRAEAEGAIDRLAAHDEEAAEDVPDHVEPDDVIDEAELHVRSDHGDLAPHAEPDDQPVEADPKLGG